MSSRIENEIKYTVKKISSENIIDLTQLEIQASEEGYKFVKRTIDEFLSGENDFTRKGEILYGVYINNLCWGICGLNIDPYTNKPGIGRLRHLYVSKQFRNKGIATILIDNVIEQAKKNFLILRLKSTPDANEFYEKFGFSENNDEHESHRLVLER